MSWNYRVAEAGTEDEPGFEIIEVYYDKDGNPDGWSEPATAFGNTIEELRADLQLMLAALDRPVFDPSNGPGTEVKP